MIHQLSEHLKFHQKHSTVHHTMYFKLSSVCLDIPIKHCISCLIYDIRIYSQPTSLQEISQASFLEVLLKSRHMTMHMKKRNVHW